MNITTYIAHLEAIKREHGDLEVYDYRMGAATKSRTPDVDYIKVPEGKERTVKFVYLDRHIKGEKVCRL